MSIDLIPHFSILNIRDNRTTLTMISGHPQLNLPVVCDVQHHSQYSCGYSQRHDSFLFFKTFISLLNVHRDFPVYLKYYKFNYIGCKGGGGGGGWGWGNNKFVYSMMR